MKARASIGLTTTSCTRCIKLPACEAPSSSGTSGELYISLARNYDASAQNPSVAFGAVDEAAEAQWHFSAVKTLC